VNIPKKHIWVIISIFVLLITLSAFSSALPDGLEWVIHKLNQGDKETSYLNTPFSDYNVHPGLPDEINQILSAVIGIGIIIVLSLIYARIKQKSKTGSSRSHEA
jgi:hypothetical protein